MYYGKIFLFEGDELWKAVVAQRKKPKSLAKQFDNLDQENLNGSSEFDDFESKLITKQVVHSFPNDKVIKRHSEPGKKEVEDYLQKIKDKIPEVIPAEPVVDATPIFRPKAKIVIKKKKSDCEFNNENTVKSGLLTSTPTKLNSPNVVIVDHSLDLFSDNSLLEEGTEENLSSALCEDYGRHVVVDCSVG